jgi:tetratricopeptide (TPR) repeat protein
MCPASDKALAIRAGSLAAIAVLLLSACGGSSPPLPEAPPEQVPASTPSAVTTTPVTEPVVETGAKPDKTPKTKTAVADAGSEGAPVEAPVPPEAQMQFDNAVASMNAGNTGSAEQQFRALSASYPTYAGPLLNLAILQTKAGKLDDAQKTLNDAIARKPSAAAYNQLGIVYRRLGRFKEADEAYQRAIEADANYALAYLNLGVLCDLYLQQPQRALEAFERYLALTPSPDAKVNGWVSELKTRLGSQQRNAKAEE